MHKTFIILFCLISTHCLGQNLASHTVKLYRATVVTEDNTNYKGVIYALNDSSISMTSLKLAKKKQLPSEQDALIIPANIIRIIKFKRAGAIGRRVLVGALLGGLSGVFIAYALLQRPCPPNTPYGCMEPIPSRIVVAGGVIGAGVGLITSSKSRKFSIGGSIQHYRSLKEGLQNYVYAPR